MIKLVLGYSNNDDIYDNSENGEDLNYGDKGWRGDGGCNFASVNDKHQQKMEQNEDIIYDLENPGLAGSPNPGNTDSPETATDPIGSSDDITESDDTPGADGADGPDNGDNVDNDDNSRIADNIATDDDAQSAGRELEKMIEEMGAETLLAIIKDNRNAAIQQIISEVESAHNRSMPSGSSVAGTCNSIFDLAALAV